MSDGKMGDLADQGAYYDPMSGLPIGAQPPAADPTAGMPPWMMNTLGQQMNYEPQGTMWPQYPPPEAKAVPEDRPNPLIPFSAYRSLPPKHTVADIAAQNIIEQGASLLPSGRLGLSAMMAMDTDPAQADRLSGLKGAGKAMGELFAATKPAIIKRPSLILPPAEPAEMDFTSGGKVPRWLSQFVGPDAQRVAYPGIYKRPDVIAKEAADMVAPEHPAMKELFGVTRDDLYEISQQGRRQGNIETPLFMPERGRQSAAAQAIMNPKNAQRMLDVLGEAEKYPELIKGMDAWYVHDPMYQQMVRLVGPERAAKEFRDFNATVSPFSAATEVPVEIHRGTAANMMRQLGRYDEFAKYGGGGGAAKFGDEFPSELKDVKGHAYHSTAQSPPVQRYIDTGAHGYDPDTVKVPLYIDSSGVPETGFQTRLPVPDAHFTRATGMPDVRTNKDYGKFMGGTEYREVGPWFREKIAKQLGIEAVPAQGRMWGAFAPQTGVETAIGAPKLELYSQRIWERAKQLGIDPKLLRDQVLRGEQHSELEDGNRGMGSLAAMDNYA